jgi:hypothetical protein
MRTRTIERLDDGVGIELALPRFTRFQELQAQCVVLAAGHMPSRRVAAIATARIRGNLLRLGILRN